MANLKLLDITEDYVRNLKFLSGMPLLESLTLKMNDIDWSPLATLTRLARLDQYGQMESSDPPQWQQWHVLMELPRLKELKLPCALDEDHPLPHVTALTIHIEYGVDLSKWTTLRSLDWWEVREHEALYFLPSNLQTLSVEMENRIELSYIGQLTQLWTLKLSGSIDTDESIEDFDFLSKLTLLEVLELPRQPIESLWPLRKTFPLRRLDLQHTKVSDVAPLAKLLKLEYVDLRHTNASDFTAVLELPSLKQLKT